MAVQEKVQDKEENLEVAQGKEAVVDNLKVRVLAQVELAFVLIAGTKKNSKEDSLVMKKYVRSAEPR
ncbi:MAG: hypothetical protein ACOC87_03925 [Candidatus Natronoplasma sp.]